MTGVEMKMTKIRPGTIVLFAALLLIGACAGESPTAPPGAGGGGGTPPPSGASISLEVSNDNPLVNSTSTITAVVSENGSPVPDGTAVEFKTTFGTFVVGQSSSSDLILTTTGGRAVATLTATAAGQAVVTARVNTVFTQTTVTFKAQTTDPTPGEPQPTITSIDPASGPPDGGTVVTMRGQNFEGPVRVLFGNDEAVVASFSSTELRVISPKVNFVVGEETREVTVTVIFEAGSTGETSVQAPSSFRYEIEALTPVVLGVSPSSGPNEGGTLLTVIGSGFQAPIKVFFGTGDDEVEAQVQQVTFSQVTVLTPKASGLGANLANSKVAIRVVNMLTGKETTTDPIFRYGPAMQITGFGPGEGPGTGGTLVTIFGWGFDDPVAVTIGGVGAIPIKVSGTEIVARTAALSSPCGGGGGPVSVTNLEDGTTAEADGEFVYIDVNPAIVAIAPSSTTPGSNITVTVADAGDGNVRFKVGDSTRVPTSATPTQFGTAYTVSVPISVEFQTQACGTGGEMFVPTELTVTFQNVTTGCSDNEGASLTVTPLDTSCRIPPLASASPSSLNFGDQAVAAGPTAALNITVSNAGGGTLTVLGANSDNTDFLVNGTFPASLDAGQSTTISVTFDPAATGASNGTITISTDAGDVSVTVSGNGT